MLIRRDRVIAAVTVMLDVAYHAGPGDLASAAGIAERLGLLRRGMEPLLQALTRAGLLVSVRGPRGGYRLARPADAIDLLQIAAAVDDTADCGTDSAGIGSLRQAVVEPLWATLEADARRSLGGLRLEDLLGRVHASGPPPLVGAG